MAAKLAEALGVEVESVQGWPGEFSVRVDGRRVAGKSWLGWFPSDEETIEAVRGALSAAAAPPAR